ncbi:hypothetical protein AS181_18995 [Gordonia sp. SGD-V-85]|nr:hypothetical protein AS181_18995 [Gordonia sp. SGD-V-85]SCC49401.1 hypothetical protein GA0061091_11940 [Gordonia sp. v-85]
MPTTGQSHGLRWLLITTGATQTFIFESNKRKLNVGASRLVSRLPEWVHDAIAHNASTHPETAAHVAVVVNISAAANILVPDLETGQRLIRAVTRHALLQAPGLQVWGSVSNPVVNGNFAAALTAAHRSHEQVRMGLPAATARFPGLPFTARCALTGLPAARAIRDGDGDVTVSEAAYRKWRESWPALAAIGTDERHLHADELAQAIVPASRLDTDLGEWTAIVHSDGNGVGQLLMGLAQVSSRSTYVSDLREFSEALSTVAVGALHTAIIDTGRHYSAQRPWILPLVVGGDDLTAVVDARYVRYFTTAYLRAFRDATSAEPVLNLTAQDVLGFDHLTASAGIAIVKPTHPFFRAYALAEELCRSAKIVKTVAPQECSVDIQVFHESVGRRLDDVRVALRAVDGDLYPGPMVIDSAQTTLTRAEDFDYTVQLLAAGVFSASERHRLRTVLTDLPQVAQPDALWRNACVETLSWVRVTRPDEYDRVETFMRRTQRAHLVSAMDLVDVEAV